VILHFRYDSSDTERCDNWREDARFRYQLSEIKVPALTANTKAGCDFGASYLTSLSFCFLVYRFRTTIKSMRSWRARLLWLWGANKIIHMETLSNRMWCMFIIAASTIIIMSSTERAHPAPELFPLGCRAISAVVKRATLWSRCWYRYQYAWDVFRNFRN